MVVRVSVSGGVARVDFGENRSEQSQLCFLGVGKCDSERLFVYVRCVLVVEDILLGIDGRRRRNASDSGVPAGYWAVDDTGPIVVITEPGSVYRWPVVVDAVDCQRVQCFRRRLGAMTQRPESYS